MEKGPDKLQTSILDINYSPRKSSFIFSLKTFNSYLSEIPFGIIHIIHYLLFTLLLITRRWFLRLDTLSFPLVVLLRILAFGLARYYSRTRTSLPAL